MHTETTTDETPRVWVGCLAAYNAGHLHGKWVEVTPDPDDLHEAIREVIESSPEGPYAEEWFFADWEYLPSSIGGDSVETMCEYADQLDRADLVGIPGYIYRAVCEDHGMVVDPDTISCWGSGEIRDTRDLGDYVLSEGLFGLEVPQELDPYIDSEAIGKDWLIDGQIIDGFYVAVQ